MNGNDVNERAGPASRLLYLPLYAGALALALGATVGIQTASAQNKIVTVVLSEEPEGLDGCNSNRSTVGRVAKQNIVETLTEIAGEVGTGRWPENRCRFAPRCPLYETACDRAIPLFHVPAHGEVRCIKAEGAEAVL